MQKITPFLWFDQQAEEAAKFYVSLFKNSKILDVVRYGDEGPKVTGRAKASVMTVRFRLDGHEFTALNGGPVFKFNEAVSLVINCRNQAEVDRLWTKLSRGGSQGQCGWLKDKYGLSWQIVPAALFELFTAKDPVKKQRVMNAMLKMRKLDIKKLQQAAAAKG